MTRGASEFVDAGNVATRLLTVLGELKSTALRNNNKASASGHVHSHSHSGFFLGSPDVDPDLEVATTAPNSANDDIEIDESGCGHSLQQNRASGTRLLPPDVARLEHDARALGKRGSEAARDFTGGCEEVQRSLHQVRTQVAQHVLEREDAQHRMRSAIERHSAELSAQLENERAERRTRAEVSEQMVQAVTSWLRSQE